MITEWKKKNILYAQETSYDVSWTFCCAACPSIIVKVGGSYWRMSF